MSNRVALLYEFSRALHRLEPAQVMHVIVNHVTMMADAADACVFTLYPDQTVETIYALDPEVVPSVWDPSIERGLGRVVIENQRTIVIRDISTDSRWTHAPGLPRRGSAVGLPLRRNGVIFGVLILIHTRIDHFNFPLLSLLEEASDVASMALANALDYHVKRCRCLLQDAV
jgi:GAF domain-containing protein